MEFLSVVEAKYISYVCKQKDKGLTAPWTMVFAHSEPRVSLEFTLWLWSTTKAYEGQEERYTDF